MIFPNLFKITPEPVGLDLSDRSIKIVKLSKKEKCFVLENFGEKTVPKGLMEDGVILSEDKLADVLKKVFESAQIGSIKTPYVSCSLPEQKTYLRVVQFPKMKKEEVGEAIRWEVEANIPLNLDEVYFDWEVIKPINKNVDHLDILVSAAPRELIDSYSSLFKKAGLKLFSLEPESIALSRSVIAKESGKKAVMIVDIGLTHMCVAIYAGHNVRFASSVAKISGYAMNEAIARAMNVDEKKAEKLKKEIGLNKKQNKSVFEALVPLMSALIDQLGEYMKFYNAHAGHSHDGKSVSKILLSGGDSHLEGIEDYLGTYFDIPIEKANPKINILDFKKRELPKLSDKESLRYATALGLALIPRQ